jgi:alkanesulfonate monooxygenase SsuD/methylene tetrahydromethanopterin reductase-like flavin-dependent oxidoreductase (luciferase family)
VKKPYRILREASSSDVAARKAAANADILLTAHESQVVYYRMFLWRAWEADQLAKKERMR